MEIRYDFILHSVMRQRKAGSGVFRGKPKSALLTLQVKVLYNMLLIPSRGGKLNGTELNEITRKKLGEK